MASVGDTPTRLTFESAAPASPPVDNAAPEEGLSFDQTQPSKSAFVVRMIVGAAAALAILVAFLWWRMS